MNDSWLQVISVFLANAGLIIWFRAESRSDWRHMDNKVDAIHKENKEIIEGIRQDIKTFQNAMHEESKNFHGRLERQDAEFKSHIMQNHAK